VNDAAHAVEVFVDRDVWGTSRWRCHPLVNSETIVLERAAVEQFLEHTGHRPRVVALETRSTVG